jgi:hypothetical protein
MDRIRTTRPPSRTGMIVAGVVAAYVAFAVFAQLIGEDEDPVVQDAASLDVFCTTLYSDYPGILQMLVYQGDSFGPAGPGGPISEGLSGGFFNVAQFAPAEFEDQAAYLVEGIQRASNGELAPNEVDAYIQAYDELRTEATPTCDRVGDQITTDEQDE